MKHVYIQTLKLMASELQDAHPIAAEHIIAAATVLEQEMEDEFQD